MSGTDKFVMVNGLRLHYVEHGDPAHPTIICLHGAGGHGRSWDTFASLISDRLHVLALTFRGHGDSDRADSYDQQAFVLDTMEFIKTMGCAPAVLCGHSLGVGPAITIAAFQPDLVKAAVIVDGGHRQNPQGISRITKAMRQRPESFGSVEDAMEWVRRAQEPESKISEDELRRYVECDLWVGDDGRQRRKTDPNYGRLGLEMPTEHAVKLREEGERFFRSAFALVKCPTLIVRGGRSAILDYETAAEMEQLIPNARLVEVDAGHFVPLEDPPGLSSVVSGFLEQAGVIPS